MQYCQNSVFYSKIVPKEDQRGESKRSGVCSVTANFHFTNVNGVCMHRFGNEKTICDFCHQGKSKIAKSRTLKLLICKKKGENKRKTSFSCADYFFS